MKNKRWTKKEINMLSKLLFEGLTYKEVGEKLNRSRRSIQNKCNKKNISFNEISRTINYEEINCLVCGNVFKDLKSNKRKFCSHECSAKYNYKKSNFIFDKTKIVNCVDCNEKTKVNIRTSPNKYRCSKCIMKRKENNVLKKNNIVKRICKKCNKNTLKKKRLFCEKCVYEYYYLYRPKCEFKFSLDDYPDKFNFDLITEFGWYSPSNKRNNLGGISRDHIYSVNDGFKNGIDPKIISHPANCQLLVHNDNSSKKTKSNITIEQLLEKIKKWKD